MKKCTNKQCAKAIFALLSASFEIFYAASKRCSHSKREHQGGALGKRNKREQCHQVHFVSNSCPSPYKNANIDTVSVNISVLILCPKSLYLRAFFAFLDLCHRYPNTKNAPFLRAILLLSIPSQNYSCGVGAKSRRGCIFFI